MFFVNLLSSLMVLKVLIYLFYFRKQRIRAKKIQKRKSDHHGLTVTIVVPAYNEEKVILTTLDALNRITYPNVAVVVVDDGSVDSTLALVKEHYGDSPKFKIISQENKGKALALNHGIKHSDSDIIVCLDSDTTVDADVIDKILPYFDDPQVAAVAGTVKVRNKKGLICDMQVMEYLTSQNYEREVFESANGILVIPGAIGAFRNSVLTELGGYSNDTLTEDTDITIKILCNNYLIKNAPDVFGYTEVPGSVEMFLKQRVRWKVGTFQVLLKYHKRAMSSVNRIVSSLVIPYTWLYCIILPCLTPLVDYLFLLHFLLYGDLSIFGYYLFYILLDWSICTAILFGKDVRSYQAFYLLFLRFILRQVTFFSYVEICIRMFKGTLFEWSRSVRYGVRDI